MKLRLPPLRGSLSPTNDPVSRVQIHSNAASPPLKSLRKRLKRKAQISRKAAEVMKAEPSDLLNRTNKKGFRYSRLKQVYPEEAEREIEREKEKRRTLNRTKMSDLDDLSVQEQSFQLEDFISVKKSEICNTKNQDLQFALYVKNIKQKIKQGRLLNLRCSDRENKIVHEIPHEPLETASLQSSVASLHHLLPKNLNKVF